MHSKILNNYQNNNINNLPIMNNTNNFNFQTRDMVQNRFVVQWYYALRFHGTNCSSMASICCGSNGRAVVQWYCATAKMSQWVS